MKSKTMIADALIMAIEAHDGQVDKSGVPYIFHPIRVGLAGATDSERIVGFLHDVLEDTAVTRAAIEQRFGKEIAKAVDSVTHRPYETYAEFIKRAGLNEIGRRVKINDLKDNLARMGNLSEMQRASLETKYFRALAELTK